MKEDLHHLTLTDHQLELLAIAYQTAIHRAANDDHMMAEKLLGMPNITLPDMRAPTQTPLLTV